MTYCPHCLEDRETNQEYVRDRTGMPIGHQHRCVECKEVISRTILVADLPKPRPSTDRDNRSLPPMARPRETPRIDRQE